jgi:hypothetical protein
MPRCDSEGAELLSWTSLYPVKHWSRYQINQYRFIDLRYNPFASSVTVRTMYVPHAPWTFSESTIDQDDVNMNGEPSHAGVLLIERAMPGAQMTCREMKDR